MAQQEFIPYEQARQLKEIGFHEECFATIDQTEYIHINGTKYPIRGAMVYRNTDAPLYQQAFRWFREKHNTYSYIEKFYYNRFDYVIIDEKNDEEVDYNDGPFNTYEEAELACIKKLIEIVKNK